MNPSPVRIAINGFGRIGRTIARLASHDPSVQIVKINDLTSPQTMVHLLKYDSVHGVFSPEVTALENAILINGKKISYSRIADITKLNWKDPEVDYVFECTGKTNGKSDCQHHLNNGAKKVIISAPAEDSDITIVYGVNEKKYDPKRDQFISNASCTTNCLAPVVQVLDQALTIQHGLMTTVHSYTNDQRIIDGGHKDLRRARAGALNMIPTSTGGAKAIGLVLPHLKGKLDGMAIRVPTPNVSLVDLVAQVEKDTTTEEVNRILKEASQGPLQGILAYSELPLVSSDYNGSTFSSVIDALSTKVLGKRLVKVLAWYDNETGFSQRMIDVAKYLWGRG
jgi:glyceraldehyde 3-phosphate dehydrogenase